MQAVCTRSSAVISSRPAASFCWRGNLQRGRALLQPAAAAHSFVLQQLPVRSLCATTSLAPSSHRRDHTSTVAARAAVRINIKVGGPSLSDHSLHRQHRGSCLRCTHSSGFSSAAKPSWLQEVVAWCPEPSNGIQHTNSNGSSAANNGSSGDVSTPEVTSKGSHAVTNNGSSSGNSDSSSSSDTPGYCPPHFQRLSEASLSDPSCCFDAIIVLAGGLTPDGGLPEWVNRRMDVARDLHLLQGRKPLILSSGGGTPHKPAVLGPSGHVIHESTSGASYLMATGVQPSTILKEVSSFDTVGNAYFSLCIHAIPAGWRRLAVVTSDFHMPRSRALFADIYRLAGHSVFGDPHWFSLTFLSASDDGVFDDHVYKARLDKEAGSLAHWQGVAAGLHNLPAFHEWFFNDHLCYAVPRQHEFGKRTIQDPKLLDSY